MLVAQRDGKNDTPRPNDLYTVGTVAAIMRMLKLPDGRIRLLVQGLTRAQGGLGALRGALPQGQDHAPRGAPVGRTSCRPSTRRCCAASSRTWRSRSRSARTSRPRSWSSPGTSTTRRAWPTWRRLNLDLKLEDAQNILESTNPIERLRLVNDSLAKEITVLTMQQEISSQARGEMDKTQREYYLRQQLRAIQQELGEGEEISEELDAYRKIIADKKIPQEAATEIEKQIKRLERSHPDSAETAIIRTYLDWMTGLPWSVVSEDSRDIDRARKILDEDHYDIEKVKERILEFLAVHALKQSLKGPILCFVGPPGVGKTSLGRSIAARVGPEVRATFPGRCPGRGRDPWPPAHLRGGDAGPHRSRHSPGRHVQPRVHDGRDRQDRRRLPRRPVGGAARGVRPGAELLLPRSLPFGPVRPLARPLHRHRERARPDPAGVPGPHGGHPPLRLHARGEEGDRETAPDPQADGGERDHRRQHRVHRQRRREGHRGLHARGGAAQPGARDRRDLPQGRRVGGEGQGAEVPHQRALRREDAGPGQALPATSSSSGTRSELRPAWPGPPSAATSCSSRPSGSAGRAACG